MFWDRQDAVADPVVAAWDAVQRGTHSVPEGIDASEAAMIASFLASDAVPAPSPRFVGQLGQRLAELELHGRPTTGWPRIETPKAGKSPRIPGIDRSRGWRFTQSAAALLLVFALGGLFLGHWRPSSEPEEPPAIPAAVATAPTMEPLVSLDFDPPMWGMPAATTWTHMDFSLISLQPGRSFDTGQGWYTSTVGPLLLYVLDGELTIQPAGPSLLYHRGMQDQPPVEAKAGQTVVLEPGDGIAYSIHDAATGSNSGTETMHALLGLAGSEDVTVPGAFTPPEDVLRDLFEYDDKMPEPLTDGARVSLQQLELRPYDTYVFDDPTYVFTDPRNSRIIMLAPDTSSTYWYTGAFDSVPAGVRSSRISTRTLIRFLGPGSYTLANVGANDVVLYFLVLEPAD